MSVKIKLQKEEPLDTFLELNGFAVEDLGNQVYRVQREDELAVFLKLDSDRIFYEIDLGPVAEVATQEVLYKLLDLNTEILPVSFGIDSSNPEDARLVLVESRETGDMNDQELLAVFDALELAVDRAEEVLAGVVS